MQTYSRLVLAVTYNAPWMARGEVAAATDNLGAVDTYADEECPPTVKCPVSSEPATERPIVVNVAS